jgi:hypothetical protein
MALLGWGIFAFIEYSQSVGANRDSLTGWIFCGLGLAGVATLRWSQVGYAAAVAHLAATALAAWWCVTAFALWRTAAVTNLGFIAPLILSFAIPMLLLCGANLAGTWQVARRTSRCT